MLRLALLLLLLGPAGLPGTAMATRADAAINQPFRDPDPAHWRAIFERPGREVWDRRQEIVRALRLRPGMAVADVGAGTGFFTLLFARAVGPSGRVYAVDTARSFVDAIRQRALALGLKNVRGVVDDQHSLGLPAKSIDLAFLADTYHHLEHPGAILRDLHAALRPGGELVVVDFRRVPGLSRPWVLGHVRRGREAVRREVEAAGFELVEARDDLMRDHYLLRFRRR